jgi:hypothetical protein
MKKLIHYTFAACLLAGVAFAQDRPTAFINARVIPISGPVLEQGVVIFQNGKITAVGDARTLRL